MQEEEKYEIEKDIPIPPKMRGQNAKYPFNEMEIGDSVFVPVEDVQNCNRPNSAVSSAANVYAKRSGKKMITRTIRENDEIKGRIIGFRVWRID